MRRRVQLGVAAFLVVAAPLLASSSGWADSPTPTSAETAALSAAAAFNSAAQSGNWDGVYKLLAPSIRSNLSEATFVKNAQSAITTSSLRPYSLVLSGGAPTVNQVGSNWFANVNADLFGHASDGTCASQPDTIELSFENGQWWYFGDTPGGQTTRIDCAVMPSGTLPFSWTNPLGIGSNVASWAKYLLYGEMIFFGLPVLAFLLRAFVTFVIWLIRANSSNRIMEEPALHPAGRRAARAGAAEPPRPGRLTRHRIPRSSPTSLQRTAGRPPEAPPRGSRPARRGSRDRARR